MTNFPIYTSLVLFALLLMGYSSPSDETGDTAPGSSVVILAFTAQPGKGAQTVSELTKLIEQVQREPHFVSITMHVDPEDPTKILLYEEWEDIVYYKTEHMQTEHLQDFQARSTAFLAGPPDVTFWEVKREFNG